MTVRPAQEPDVSAIVACYLRSWRAAYDTYLPPDVLDEEAEKRRSFDWTNGIRSGAAAVFVSPGADGTVTGVVQVDEAPPPPRTGPEVVMLYVDPAAWGTEVARRLLAEGVRWAAHRGHSELRLRVVEAHGRARRFYEREGWSEATDLAPDPHDVSRLIWYRRSLSS